jgi:hypothetical protein
MCIPAGCSRVSTPAQPHGGGHEDHRLSDGEMRHAALRRAFAAYKTGLAAEHSDDRTEPGAWLEKNGGKYFGGAMAIVEVTPLLPREEALRIARQRARLKAIVFFWMLIGGFDPKSPSAPAKSTDDPTGIVLTTRIPPRALASAILQKEDIRDNGMTLYATYVWKRLPSTPAPATQGPSRAAPDAGGKRALPRPMVFTEEVVTDRCDSSGVHWETKEFLNSNAYEYLKSDGRPGAEDFILSEWYENGRKYQHAVESGSDSTITVWYDTGEKAGEMVTHGSHEHITRYRKDGSAIETSETKQDNGRKGK